MRAALLCLLLPGLAGADVAYTMSTANPAGLGAPPTLAFYAGQGGRLRAAAADGHLTYLFRDRTLYVVEEPAHAVHQIIRATVAQVAAAREQQARQIEASAATYSGEKREQMRHLAEQMRAMSAHRDDVLVFEYRRTARRRTVDGIGCQVVEAAVRGTKRFEFCVAPVAKVPAGAELLAGLRMLAEYHEGSVFALGASLGGGRWWPAIEGLAGVPLAIREFKDGGPSPETTLLQVRDKPIPAALFELPAGYPVGETDFIR